MEYTFLSINSAIKDKIVAEVKNCIKVFPDGYKLFTTERVDCPYCQSIQSMDDHEEGFWCNNTKNCGQMANFCRQCGGWMDLLNYSTTSDEDDFSATNPPQNVSQPFKPIYDAGSGWTVDDRTHFYWKCEECNQEITTHCD